MELPIPSKFGWANLRMYLFFFVQDIHVSFPEGSVLKKSPHHLHSSIMAGQEMRLNHTIYINNLNEKIKKDGTF